MPGELEAKSTERMFSRQDRPVEGTSGVALIAYVVTLEAASAFRSPFRLRAKTADTLRANAKAPMAQCDEVRSTRRPATKGAKAARPVATWSVALLTRPRMFAGVFRSIAAKSAALLTGEMKKGSASSSSGAMNTKE